MIAGKFGTSVTSYFRFLKWLFGLNIFITLLLLGVVVLTPGRHCGSNWVLTQLFIIVGNFGTSVTSYFRFLKWLFGLNIFITLLLLGVVVLTQVFMNPDTFKQSIANLPRKFTWHCIASPPSYTTKGCTLIQVLPPINSPLLSAYACMHFY